MWPCRVQHVPPSWELWVTNSLFSGSHILICWPHYTSNFLLIYIIFETWVQWSWSSHRCQILALFPGRGSPLYTLFHKHQLIVWSFKWQNFSTEWEAIFVVVLSVSPQSSVGLWYTSAQSLDMELFIILGRTGGEEASLASVCVSLESCYHNSSLMRRPSSGWDSFPQCPMDGPLQTWRQGRQPCLNRELTSVDAPALRTQPSGSTQLKTNCHSIPVAWGFGLTCPSLERQDLKR